LIKNIVKSIRNCPICLSDEGEMLHEQKFILPDSSPLPNKYNILSCTKCAMVYADTCASQYDYDLFYKNMSKYEDKKASSGSGNTEYDKERLNVTAWTIIEHIDKYASILDIGCANGGLLKTLKDMGCNNLTGLDPSPACVNNLKESGINGVQGGLFDIENIKNNKYDCIILSHVFEHIRDLQSAVINLLSLLEENGIMYVEVPDASRYKDYYVVPYYYFDSEHINHFDENALNNLFLQFETECITQGEKEMPVSNSKYYPAVYSIYKKSAGKHDFEFKIDSSLKENVKEFINQSKKNNDNNELKIFVNDQEKVVVWGAGSFTTRLLENSDLGKCNIVAFIDKDTNKQGNKIKNIEILSPSILEKFSGTIIVCSALYSDEIVQEIKVSGFNNPIIVIK